MAEIALIAALARNRVIGRGNELPWRLPADMRHFKQVTMGKPIIMGRKTFESIGRPLTGRHNIILTRQGNYQAPGCTIASDVAGALAAAGAAAPGEIMVIGGAAVYAVFLPLATRMYLTFVDADVAGDVYFPPWDESAWREVDRVAHPADERHAYAFARVTLVRWLENTAG